MAAPEFPIQRVESRTLQTLFNAEGFWEKVQNWALTAHVISERMAPPAAHQPPGTRSQIVSYRSGGLEVARVHQYVRPDGTLGGSGKPDPKKLLLNGVLYCYSP